MEATLSTVQGGLCHCCYCYQCCSFAVQKRTLNLYPPSLACCIQENISKAALQHASVLADKNAQLVRTEKAHSGPSYKALKAPAEEIFSAQQPVWQ